MEGSPHIDENDDFSGVINDLLSMFGNVTTREVISAIVESCSGDLNQSLDALMEIIKSDSEENSYLDPSSSPIPQILITLSPSSPDSPPADSDISHVNIENDQPIATNQNMPITPDLQQPSTSHAAQIHSQPIQEAPKISTVTNQKPSTSIDSSIQKEGNVLPKEDVKPNTTNQNMPLTPQPSASTSEAKHSPGARAVPKPMQRPPPHIQHFWTDQIRNIIKYFNQGSRILILMRGVPGCGKSYLSKQLIDMLIGPDNNNYKFHILSTDDYFMTHGHYRYAKHKLPEAHKWNHFRVAEATRKGLSPIIVDNTNVELWEMEPYLIEGVKNGYIIEVVEPTTPWANNANQLAIRNIHNVPIHSIRRMLDNYRYNVTGETLIRACRLTYPAHMVPPVRRTLPPIPDKETTSTKPATTIAHVNLSADAIMDITSDGNAMNVKDNSPAENENKPITPKTIQPSTSHSTAAQSAQNTGAIPKKMARSNQEPQSFWTDQIREIIRNHNQGYRTLIIMRGLPGSGKSYLAKQLIDMTIGGDVTNYKTHIFSTDDYFMVRGQYHHDKYKLSEAHAWNHNRVNDATAMGLSPIIVDNTNVEMWEMEPYLRQGIRNGYIIEVVEPTTPWAKNAYQLSKKNIHNVPLLSIKRKLENYYSNITTASLKQKYGLSYPAHMVPPVKRAVPPIPAENSPAKSANSMTKEITGTLPSTNTIVHNHIEPGMQLLSTLSTVHDQTEPVLTNDNPKQQNEEIVSTTKKSNTKDGFLNDENDDLLHEEQQKQMLYLEARKKLDEIEKVEKEWENGENWNAGDQTAVVPPAAAEKSNTKLKIITNPFLQNATAFEIKPQRQSPRVQTPNHESAESLMQTVNDCQDWSKISMFMPPWVDSAAPSTPVTYPVIPVETITSSTCFEFGDTDVNGKYKVITASPRNINEFHVSINTEKIPQKRMLDKSSMTNESIITETFRCANEEKHFIAFRKLFKNIARSDLRDIFDKCCGDVNWAVEIVLDGMNNNQLKTASIEELSDPEEESINQCECLANYNIIPDVATSQASPEDENTHEGPVGLQAQKKKKDVTMSEENIQIKRQIEQNVVISDDHYSKHCLKIRKIRRGEHYVSDEDLAETSEACADAAAVESNDASSINADDSDDDNEYNFEQHDKIVNVTLGNEFIEELDSLFGRKGMQYPENIVPRISIPLSVLNEINALWMESLMYQLDEHAQETAAMVQQDEEFARQIAMKEAELSLAGKEPEIPDFKEIMDMDLALATYQKDVGEWRNNLPTDMAAKLSRNKLFKLFPCVEEDTLSEMLMAHDNNFHNTVEVLLLSTGRSDVLETPNGVNKFIMQKELEQKDKILEKQRKELSEEDWPLLSPDHKVEMSTVEAYREEADQHLARRNLNFQKAQDCIRRGMTQVANYYSDIANFHRQKYEQANGFAVASLMQYHALKNPDCTTIDLHFLRVKEAKELLDLFIDSHITKLREAGNQRSIIIFFITGRGKNSQGRARIKPATIQRLKERNLGYVLKNPGLLSSRINVDTKLTYQILVP